MVLLSIVAGAALVLACRWSESLPDSFDNHRVRARWPIRMALGAAARRSLDDTVQGVGMAGLGVGNWRVASLLLGVFSPASLYGVTATDSLDALCSGHHSLLVAGAESGPRRVRSEYQIPSALFAMNNKTMLPGPSDFSWKGFRPALPFGSLVCMSRPASETGGPSYLPPALRIHWLP